MWDISCNVCPTKLSWCWPLTIYTVLSVLQMHLGAYIIAAWGHFRRRQDSEFQITHAYIHIGKIAFCCKTRAWPATGIGSISPTILLFVIQTGKPEYEFSIHIWYWLAPNCKAKAKRCNKHRVSICLYWSESSQGEMVCLQLVKGNLQCKIVWCSHIVYFYDTLLEDRGYLSMCNQLGKQTSWFFLYKLINTDFIAVTSNDRHGVSNYRYCLFNSLFRLTTKKHQRSAILCLMRGMIPLTKGQ